MVGTLGVNLAVVASQSAARGADWSAKSCSPTPPHPRADVMTSIAGHRRADRRANGQPLRLDPEAAGGDRGRVHRKGGLPGRRRDASKDPVRSHRDRDEADNPRGGHERCPACLGSHHIRTRGTADHVFLDLHIWLDPATRLDAAHASIACREGPRDGAVPADRGRHYSHRTTPSGAAQSAVESRQLRVEVGSWQCQLAVRTEADDCKLNCRLPTSTLNCRLSTAD